MLLVHYIIIRLLSVCPSHRLSVRLYFCPSLRPSLCPSRPFLCLCNYLCPFLYHSFHLRHNYPPLSPSSDVDECKQSTQPCDPSFECFNTVGSFLCRCPKGTMESDGVCVDKKSFAGTVRATAVNYTEALANKTSPEYQEMERRAVQEVRQKSNTYL